MSKNGYEPVVVLSNNIDNTAIVLALLELENSGFNLCTICISRLYYLPST